jgi:hypothetical protein
MGFPIPPTSKGALSRSGEPSTQSTGCARRRPPKRAGRRVQPVGCVGGSARVSCAGFFRPQAGDLIIYAQVTAEGGTGLCRNYLGATKRRGHPTVGGRWSIDHGRDGTRVTSQQPPRLRRGSGLHGPAPRTEREPPGFPLACSTPSGLPGRGASRVQGVSRPVRASARGSEGETAQAPPVALLAPSRARLRPSGRSSPTVRAGDGLSGAESHRRTREPGVS